MLMCSAVFKKPPAGEANAPTARKMSELLLIGAAAVCCVVLIIPAAEDMPRLLAAVCLAYILLSAFLLDRSKRRNPSPGALAREQRQAKQISRLRQGCGTSERERDSLFPPASSILAPPGAPFDPETGLDTMVAPLSAPTDFEPD
jgi:hypothetical protein